MIIDINKIWLNIPLKIKIIFMYIGLGITIVQFYNKFIYYEKLQFIYGIILILIPCVYVGLLASIRCNNCKETVLIKKVKVFKKLFFYYLILWPNKICWKCGKILK